MAVVGGLLASADLFAAEQAERALAAVKRLVAAGEIRPGTTLRLAFKQGNINALLGPRLEIQKEWEAQTGIVLAPRVIPQRPAVANLREHPDVDLTVARNNEYPDLLHHGLVAELGPLMKEFGFAMTGDMPDGFIRPALQARIGDRLVAIPADGDVSILYLRRDLMEDPKERAAYRKATGRELAAPQTWKQYLELVRFFHRPDQGLIGSGEQRDPETGWMFWFPRYLSQANSLQPLFDERMKPLVDSPAGIAATENYVAIAKYMAPGAFESGRDYSFTLPLFVQGKAFSSIFTIAAAKLFNAPSSPVRGRFIAVALPGTQVGKSLVRANSLIYGNNLVVSRKSANAKLAFLFAMWLTDPDVSTRTVGVAGGFTDPYRWHHLADSRIRELYSEQALRTSAGEWEVAYPPGTGLPGDGEYLDALDRQLALAVKGELSAADAMRRTAAEWERITESYGRDRQLREWQVFRKSALRRESGLPRQ